MNGIDPKIIKFIVALIIASVVIELLDRVSSAAAWALVFVLILGLFLNNPLLIGFLNVGANNLTTGLQP